MKVSHLMQLLQGADPEAEVGEVRLVSAYQRGTTAPRFFKLETVAIDPLSRQPGDEQKIILQFAGQSGSATDKKRKRSRSGNPSWDDML